MLLPQTFVTQDLSWLFSAKSRYYSYETRNKADLYLHSVNTISLFGQRYIKFKGALLWNDLPDYIKIIRSINKFKSKLKSYLQQNYILE